MELKKTALLGLITLLTACGGETFTGTDFGATVTQTENALFTPPLLTAEDHAFFTVNDFLDSIRLRKLELEKIRSYFAQGTTDDTLTQLAKLKDNPIFTLETAHLSYQLASRHQDKEGNWLLTYVIRNVGTADFEQRFTKAYRLGSARGETLEQFVSHFNLQESDFLRTAFSFRVQGDKEGHSGIIIQKDQVEALVKVLIPTLNFKNSLFPSNL